MAFSRAGGLAGEQPSEQRRDVMAQAKVVFPASKRIFDLVVVFGMAPIWLPVLVVCALALLAFEGRPVFYVSRRRVHGEVVMPILKFRTLRRNADALFNRETVPVTAQRFLNLPLDSPLYTRTGRIIERLMLTELPQIWHVIQGRMSVVGNRPLPVNVVESLREAHPGVDMRFLAPAGLTGPVQLVGRDCIEDGDRLALEFAYVARVSRTNVVFFDLGVLTMTVAASLSDRWRMTYAQAMQMTTISGAGPSSAATEDGFGPREAREPSNTRQ
jgi:lipopolysaccharide/colanic/teichoic acid biosynthesis glycosyltransferase